MPNIKFWFSSSIHIYPRSHHPAVPWPWSNSYPCLLRSPSFPPVWNPLAIYLQPSSSHVQTIAGTKHRNKYISLWYIWSLMAISDARDDLLTMQFSMLITAVAFTGTARMRELACMHAVHHRTIDCRVRSKISGMSAMIPAATVILATRPSSVSTTVSYTSCFMCPQRKKSRHVRSCDLGSQATGPPRPIHRIPKVAFRWFLTAMLKWASAHSPTLSSLHLRHRSFYNPSSASLSSQLILQPFRCFTYVTGTSPTSPGEPMNSTIIGYVRMLQ